MRIRLNTAISAVLRPAFLAALALGAAELRANPTGGQVASGTASITTAPGVLTIDQLTSKAVINWQTFSIGAGELTKFVQPSSASATLNRVLGGQMSVIDGTLSSNGQVYLLNGNGILIGPGGAINTSGFIGSTRDISDGDFGAGNLHFIGAGDSGVTNLGKITAIGGDVVFIGKTVDNEGAITAASGHVGLAAGDDVMVSQSGMEHVFVRSTAGATSAAGRTGVNNAGTIVAAAAELRAANGNIYALATNNSGIIRATGVASENGHIWLVAEGNQGVTQNTGTLVARGAAGQGGAIETSGGTVVAHGTVDAGNGGSWLIDPSNITIDAPTAATLVTSLNGGSTVTEDSSLGTGGSGDITVTAPINWTGTGTLDLYAFRNLAINAAITGNSGSLGVKSATGGSGTVTTSAAGTVSVASFAMQGGSWVQNAGSLPAFAATNFTITSGSFLRAAGGSGTAGAPYQVNDEYGLQGIGSSGTLLGDSWRVSTAINASGTSGWNSGAGFAPITGFTGTFNGNGDAISGLFIDRIAGGTATNVGLFGSSSGTILDVIMTGANITGLANVGGLVGNNSGSVATSSVLGAVKGTNGPSSTNIGGFIGLNSGAVDSSFSTTTVTGYTNVGGFVGSSSGTLTSDNSTGNTASFLNASLSGSDIGGLVGLNSGPIVLSFTTGSVNATDTAQVGGLVGGNAGAGAIVQQGQSRGSIVLGFSQVGGLIGQNSSAGQIIGGKVIDGTGTVGVTGTVDVGGLVGNNSASVIDSSVVSAAGTILGKTTTTQASNIGGFVGTNSGTVSDSFALLGVGEAGGTTNAQFVGGFAGFNTSAGSLSGTYSTGNVTATGAQFVGGFVGENDGTLGVQTNASGNVTGGADVGGLIGSNTGTLGTQSFASGNITGVTFVGGLIGINTTSTTVVTVYAKGTVAGTSQVGGLIGSNVSGNFTSSTASGGVSGTGTQIGGLMGHNGGVLTLDSAGGNVTAPAASSVGGLVGDNSGTISSGAAGSVSSASGNVVGSSAVGGLVGNNTTTGVVGDPTSYVAALADYTQARGSVTGLTLVGGLVGDNAGSVSQGAASGPVNGSASATAAFGGLVGRNETTGSITTSFSTSTVHANGGGTTNGAATDVGVGGLVGANLGQITRSNASGNVVGDLDTGGLVGLQDAGGAVTQISYSTGNVTGLVNTGGFVGYNELGSVTQNYSTSTTVGSTSVGGLVGLDAGSISENYSTGNVTGTSTVGGLVGQIAASGTLTQSYATGVVSGAGAGGLAGANAGAITFSFWDGTSTGQGATGVGSGSSTGATELTSSTAYASASYAGFGSVGTVAGADSAIKSFTSGAVAWYMFEGGTRPYLAWEAPINSATVGGAHVIYTAHQLQLVSVDLGGSYVLGKGVDLTATTSATDLWNPATGFVPIGETAGQPFSGTFGGASFGISNLFISRSSTDDIGLFGASSGSIGGISLGGTVTGRNDVGLLVGLNSGSVSGARLSGTVAGQNSVGGAAGENDSSVSSSAVNVAVSGNNTVGGISGFNTGTVQDSYAIGAVTGSGVAPTGLGGLVGSNTGTVTIAYATGNVSGGAGSDLVGGAIGELASGNVSQVYATGAVTGTQGVGGLVGTMTTGTLLQSYATGSVNASGATSEAGGLVGELDGGSVSRSYASGVVTGAQASTTGGLVGQAVTGATYSNLFWDSTKSATSFGTDTTTGPGPITDLHGDTIDGATATYAGFSSTSGFTAGFGSSALVYGSGDSVWRIQKGSEFPFLTQLSTQVSGTAFTDETHTTNVGAGVSVTLNGSSLLHTATTDSNGAFAFLFAADDGLFNYIPHTGATLRINDAGASADSVAAALPAGNSVPDLLADLTQADTWGTTVRAISPGLDNQLLVGAGSSFVSNPGGNAFGGTNVAISENFDVASTAGLYAITGDITSTGDFTLDSAAAVPVSFDHPVTLDAVAGSNPHPTFTQNAAGTLSSSASNRAIIVESAGNYVNNVGAGAFSTPSGSWIVYSQNPPGSGQSVIDDTNGLDELHLYGTNPTQTPAYLLSPGLDYQIYAFTPTITLTASANSSTGTTMLTYGDATPALTFSQVGLLPGDSITAGVTHNQVISNQPGESTTYAQFSNVGTYPVTFIPSTLPTSLIGYNLVFAPGSIIVNPAAGSAVTIMVSGSQNFAYIGGGPVFSFTATGSVAGDPNFHPTFMTSVTQFMNVNRTGSAVVPYMGTITLNAASISNYTGLMATTVDLGFTVNPAALTITANGTSIYGEAINTPTLTSNSTSGAGTIYDDSGTGTTVTLASQGYTGTNPAITSASHVGNNVITVAGPTGTTTTGDLQNYNVTITPGNYAITQRALVIDGTQNEAHVYDGTPGQTTFGSTDYSVGATATGTGLVNGDTVTGLMGRVSNTVSDVGHYDYTVGTLGTTDSNPGDYNLVYSNMGFGLNITPLALTVGILKGTTKVYGDADPLFTFGNGFYGVTAGALAAGDSFTAAGQPGRQVGEPVNGGTAYQFNSLGTIGIMNGGGTSTTADYTLAFSNPSNFGLVITPAPLVVTANDDSKTYNSLAYSGGNGVTYMGFKLSEGSGVLGGALTYAGTSQGAVNAGTYGITPQGYTSGNYTISYVAGTLTVNQAPLTITADDQSKTYGGADPTLTFTPSGTLFGADTYAGVISGTTLTTATGALATAGNHPITASGAVATNYFFSYVPGTLAVAKANLTVTANAASTTYGTQPVVTFVVGGTLFYGDLPGVVTGVSLLSSFGVNPVVGTYSATPIGGVAANYNITDIGVTNLTVTKAPLYATADDKSKVYGDPDPALTYVLSGTLFYGDTYGVVSGVSVAAPTGAAATAGTHPIDTLGGVAANYQVFDIPGTLTVSKATLTATADNQSKVYGAADPALTYTPSGTLFYGDTYGVISGVGLATATGAAATAGTHEITATGGTSTNYTIVDVDATLTVSKASLTVTADDKSKTYGGADPALTYTVAGLAYGDSAAVVTGVGLSTTTGSAATAGTHPIDAVGGVASNYDVTDFPGTLTVNKALLTISADPEQKFAGALFTFGGTEYTSSGLLGSDTISQLLLSTPGSPVSAPPGSYTITPSGASGTGLSNYTITYVTAPFEVVPSIFSQLPLSWANRYSVDQTIGALFDPAYGERRFYELEVPGTIHRVIPSDLDGIGLGSSLVDVRIGLEAIYSLDRFQSFRH